MKIKIKKAIAITLVLIMAFFCLAGCGSQGSTAAETSPEENSGLKIVTTIYPEYAWVKEILGALLNATAIVEI